MKSIAGWIVVLLSSATSGGVAAQGVVPPDDREAPQEPARNAATGSTDVGVGKPPTIPPSPTDGNSADRSASARDRSTSAGASSAVDKNEIVVVKGQQLRGSVVGEIPPEQTYTALDLTVYGADDVGALIRSVGSQTASNQEQGGGQPLVLLNGRRVSNFGEVARIPTEAIKRMEVFPAELALKYGFQPDRKVVNIVTYELFTSRIGQADYAGSTNGGYDRVGAAATLFSIRNALQFNLNAQYSRAGAVLESERGIRQAAPDAGGARSILPTTENIAFNGTVSRPIKGSVSATINGRFEHDTSNTLLGAGSGGQVTRKVDTDVLHLSATLNGRAGKWLWSVLGNYDHTDIDIATRNGQVAQLGDTGSSSNALGTIEVLTNGPVIGLPAGSATVSLRAGLGTRDFVSKSRTEPPIMLGRGRGTFQASLDIPIHKAATATTVLGRLALNANAAVETLSDFGTLKTFGYGIYWSPIAAINMYASVTRADTAPRIEQIGAPRIATPNVRAFDFAQHESVEITQVFGGNPALVAEDRRTASLGIYAHPLKNADLALSIGFFRTRTDNPIASFPFATAELETAFPSRYTRDSSGRLQRIDTRPLNFKRSDQRRLRSGFTFTSPLGKGPPLPKGETVSAVRSYPNEAAMRASLPPGMVVVQVAADSEDARRIEALSSRVTVSLYHTWNLKDTLMVQTGGPVLDLLNGSATDFRGGTRRHQLEFQAGFFKNGLGARVTTNWQSGTTVRDVVGSGSDDLRFSDYSTTDVSLFVLPAQQLGGTSAPEWLKKLRVTLNVANVFNTRPRVVDASGTTPVVYQAAYLEPLGRVVSLRIRKIF